ncbi:NAD(+) diphosphatase [Rhodobacter sp. Har01]|uniref:NAD(+) diphosphatase n=1 Tax=Rhodobacter sp. Har01 TaxID=2883999 RepID=UPI001D070E59|nr:NAD(+) diphosphatase [Rhodobacter sp. Har01]MCB6179553.1 NAD(+) diphosphatase [Rhodobacter sp. Har01]
MRDTDGMAFIGSELDRAQELRTDPEALAALAAAGRVLPFWRGRPLIGAEAAGWLDAGHPILAAAAETVFLGRLDGRGMFAADVSARPLEAGAAATGSSFDVGDLADPEAPAGLAYADLRQQMTALDPVEAELAATGRALLEWHRSHRFCAACGTPSLAVRGGWQRQCPACGAEHFPRTDPVVIMLVTLGNRTLLGRSPGWPPGMFSCLAGFVEPGETLEAAVRREVAEETGLRCGPVRYLASQPWPFPSSLMLGARTEAETEALTPDPSEIEEALWIGREELLTVFAGTHPRIRAPRRGAIARHLLAMWLADRLDSGDRLV